MERVDRAQSIEDFAIEVGYVALNYINAPTFEMKPTQKKEIESKIASLIELYAKSLDYLAGKDKEKTLPLASGVYFKPRLENDEGNSARLEGNIPIAVSYQPHSPVTAIQSPVSVDIKAARAIGRDGSVVPPQYNGFTGNEGQGLYNYPQNGFTQSEQVKPRNFTW